MTTYDEKGGYWMTFFSLQELHIRAVFHIPVTCTVIAMNFNSETLDKVMRVLLPSISTVHLLAFNTVIEHR